MHSGKNHLHPLIKIIYAAFGVSVVVLFVAVGALFYLHFTETPAGDSSAQLQSGSYNTALLSNENSIALTEVETPASTVTDDAATASSLQTNAGAEDSFPPTYVPEDLRGARDSIQLTDSKIAEIRASSASHFYFSHLNNDEQKLYAEIYYILTNLASDVYVSTTTPEMLEKVQICVLNDHPEIFYVSGYYSTRYTLGDQLVGYTFSGKYIYDRDEIDRRSAAIDSYIASCLSGLPVTDDDYPRIKYIYEYIISNTAYDLSAPDNQNICSVMINGVSVCQGYAKSAQLLLNRAGIPATLVIGTVKAGSRSGPHAWNMVSSNGNWYFMDVTWGDASFQDGDNVSHNIGYEYLLTTSADIAPTHTIGSVVSMPVCSHMEDNYYVREGAYFAELSFDNFGALVAKKQAEGAHVLTFKCASDEVYDAYVDELITNSKIFDYLNTAPGQSLKYSLSKEHRSMTLWF